MFMKPGSPLEQLRISCIYDKLPISYLQESIISVKFPGI